VSVKLIKCPECKGEGTVKELDYDETLFDKDCPKCEGTGQIQYEEEYIEKWDRHDFKESTENNH